MCTDGNYISREAAIDIMCKILCDGRENCDENTYCCSAKLMESIPAADVRPVVLCRDCKWTKTDEMDDPAIYCMQWDRWETPPDGFCWLGEKREES